MDFYCPKCGVTGEVEPWEQAAAGVRFLELCPTCGALWSIEMQFYELPAGEAVDDGAGVAAVYEEWKRDPSSARSYADIRAELVKEGKL